MSNQKSISRFVESKAYISKDAWRVLTDKFKNKRFAVQLLLAAIEGLNPEKLAEDDLEDIFIDLNALKTRIGYTGNDTIRVMKQAIRYILEAPIEFENDELWSITPFFHRAMIHKQKAIAKVSISPMFIHHLSNLKQFLTLRSRIIGANTRALIFYGALKSVHNSNIFKITIDELMEKCHQKYSTYSGFKNRFMVPVIKELAKHGIEITYEEYKKTTSQKVEALSFTIKENILLEEQLSQVHQTEIKNKKFPSPAAEPSRYKSDEKNRKLLEELRKPVELTAEQQAAIKETQARLREQFNKKFGWDLKKN